MTQRFPWYTPPEVSYGNAPIQQLQPREQVSSRGIHLEWTSSQPARVAQDSRLKQISEIVHVAPASIVQYKYQRQDLVPISNKTLQGIGRHVKQHYPSVSIPFGNLSQVINEDTTIRKQHAVFTAGSRIAAVPITSPGDPHAVLAYPTGENAERINLALCSLVSPYTIEVPAKATLKLQTPLLQLDSCCIAGGTSLLGVRTLASIQVFSLSARHPTLTFLEYEPIFSIIRENLENRRPLDFTFSPFNCSDSIQALVVTSEGKLFRSSVTGTTRIGTWQQEIKSGAFDAFARVAYGSTKDEVVLALEDQVTLHDERTSKDTIKLFSIDEKANRPVIADLLKSRSRPSQHQIICTTEHVALLDQRMPGKAVFSWRHHRERDLSLQIRELESNTPERRILLSSSRSPVKTIYSYSADIAPFQTQPAYILPMGEGDSAGLASVATSDGNTLLFQGMDDGSVQAAIYGQAEEEVEIEVEWQKGVEKQAKKMLPRCPPGDLWVAKSKSDRKTRKALFAANLQSEEDISPVPLAQVDNLSTEQLRAAEDEDDTPDPRRLRTAFEALALAHPQAEEFQPRASIFFSPAFLQAGHFPLDILADQLSASEIWQNVPHHYQIQKQSRPNIPVLIPDAVSDLAEMAEQGSKMLDMYTSSSMDDAAVDRMRQAVDQVVLDMNLSNRILSSHRLPPVQRAQETEEGDQILGVFKDKLSDYSAIQHSWFIPTRYEPREDQKKVLTAEDEDAEGDYQIDTDAARLLLSEWPVGGNPHRFDYQNPYADENQDGELFDPSKPKPRTIPEPARFGAASQPAPGKSVAFSQIPSVASSRFTRPPTIESASQPAVAPSFSQPLWPRAPASSQVMGEEESQPTQMISTQILPGAHGGRPKPKKKKKMAGF